MHSSREQQGEIRKPFKMSNASKQRKTIEWERLQDLIKKIRDTKGIFHAKMDTLKDRNVIDLTEAEDIKRWQEYTELYKKDLHDADNHDGCDQPPRVRYPGMGIQVGLRKHHYEQS